MPEKITGNSIRIERDLTGKINYGDLVKFRGDDADILGAAPKYRAMAIISHKDSDMVWIGSAAFTPEEIAEFQRQLLSGNPRDPKFKHCRPVQRDRLQKVLDS